LSRSRNSLREALVPTAGAKWCDADGVRVGLFVVVIGWFAGWWLLSRVPRLTPSRSVDGPSGSALASVSVIIPARNEAHNLPHLLGSLNAQSPGPREVIVVDDGSTDGTAAVARDLGATVIQSAPLPDGWTGKSWACSQGAEAASGAVLVFLDADVRLLEGGLAAVVDAHQRLGGLLSVQPYHRMERPYERLSAVFNTIAVMGVGVAGPGREGRSNGAFGPCLVTSTEDYHRVGGHGAVRDEILEDLALGKVFADSGQPVHGAGGRSTVEFRMYPQGLGQLVEGWSKNMASGSARIGRVRLLATIVWVCGVMGASAEMVQWLVGVGSASTADVWVGYLLFAAQLAVMWRQLGNFGWWPVVAYPIPFAAFVVVFFDSLWLTVVRRRVRWRGRTIPLPERRGSLRRAREG
jgi:4,4'-diaponeurosporenoate glycosyltransferase